MHPDAIIAGLRRELERLDKSAEDYADRKKAIEDEIARVDDQPRPDVEPEAPETVVDHNQSYLAGLRKELERVGEHMHDEIKAEIKRVEALIHSGVNEPADDTGEDLGALTRDELNERAAAAGVEDADKLPNKDAVISAIEAARGS